MKLIGWEVRDIGGVNIFVKKLPLIGSVIKIQRPNRLIDLDEINNFAGRERAILVKIEPNLIVETQNLASLQNKFKMNNWQKDKWPLLPTKTLRIDLTRPLEKIKKGFDKDCRYCLRKAEGNGLFVKVSGRDVACRASALNINDFSRLWEQNARQRGFWLPIKKNLKALWETFNKNAYIVNVSCKDAKFCVPALASALILTSAKTAYYYHAASTADGRRLEAPYLLIWESLKLAQKINCKIFDFEGIYDQRYPKKQKSWLGFSHFKKSFGGEEITFYPPQIKFYNPLAKFLLAN